MEEVITQINLLQDKLSRSGFQNLIQLPEIVVVGEQSSGKSSVLQSIIEREILPKGQGIVTKCPIRIRMKKLNANEEEYAKFDHVPDKKFKFENISEEILSRTAELCSNNKFISDTEITLDMFSSYMVSLTLVDLPGIVSIRTEGQPKNIVEKIENMILNKITNQNVLILAVSPGHTDIANSKALAMAKKVDPQGKRTIGVFTKIDRIEPGTNAIELIEGIKYHLELGYVGVICRSQQEINEGKTLEDQFNREIEFFSNNELYNKKTNLFGIGVLKDKLEVEFKNHIMNTMPSIYKEVEQKIANANKELASLGENAPEGNSIYGYSHGMIDKLFKNIECIMNGSFSPSDCKTLHGGAALREVIKKFHIDMEKINNIYEIKSNDIKIAIFNSGGLEGSYPSSNSLIKGFIKENINRRIKPIISMLLENISKTYDKIISSIDFECFKQFQKFQKLFKNKFYYIKEKCFLKLTKKLNFLADLESKFLDPDLIIIKEEIKTPNEPIKSVPDPNQPVVKSNQIPENKIDFNLEDLISITTKYFLISKNSLNESIPKYTKYLFIDRVITELQEDLKLYVNNSENLKEIYHESPQIIKKRNYFKEQKKIYEEVSLFLNDIKSNFGD